MARLNRALSLSRPSRARNLFMAPHRSVFSNYAFYYNHGLLYSRNSKAEEDVGLKPQLGSYVIIVRIPDNGISVFGGVSSSMGRPTFAGRIQNVTVHVGKEAVLACPVNNIGKYKVRQHHVDLIFCRQVWLLCIRDHS